MEILRLQVKGEDIGQNGIERAGDVPRCLGMKIGRGGQRGLESSDKILVGYGGGRVMVGSTFHDRKPRAELTFAQLTIQGTAGGPKKDSKTP
jgi:hypothetical protein